MVKGYIKFIQDGRNGLKMGKCIPTIQDDSVAKETPSHTHVLFKSFALTLANCLKIKTEQPVYLKRNYEISYPVTCLTLLNKGSP